MKISILATTFLSSFVFTVNGGKDVIKFTYKENSNTASVSSYWQTDPCIDTNYIELFASDGYIKQTGSSKVTFMALEVTSTFYTGCTKTGATRTDFNFFSTDPVSGIKFASLNNFTLATSVPAYFTKSKCVIQSFNFPESGELSLKYYVCGDPYESGTKTVSINTVMKVTTGVNADEYSSVDKGVERGPGYVLKYESKSRCKTTVTTKNIVKVNNKALYTIPLDEFSTFGNICKASSGSSERIMFI
jgi:hypothetical protein